MASDLVVALPLGPRYGHMGIFVRDFFFDYTLAKKGTHAEITDIKMSTRVFNVYFPSSLMILELTMG